MRVDFERMVGRSQISRLLKQLVADGKLVRLGYGTDAKARPGSLSGKPVPRESLADLALETLGKLNVPVTLGCVQPAHVERRTTQIPVRTTFDAGDRVYHPQNHSGYPHGAFGDRWMKLRKAGM